MPFRSPNDIVINDSQGSIKTFRSPNDEIVQTNELPKTPIERYREQFAQRVQDTESRIASRKNAWQTFLEEKRTKQDIFKHPLAAEMQPFVYGMKAIKVPLEKIFSPLASAGLDIQRGNINDILPNVVKAIKGERVPAMPDIPQTAGVHPVLSQLIGLGTEAGILSPMTAIRGFKGLTNIPETASKAGTELSTIGRGISESPIISKIINMKRFLSGEQLPQKAETIANDLENLKSLFGKGKAQAIKDFSETPIKNISNLNDKINELNLPEIVTKKLKDPLYKIEYLKDGSIKPTMGNMDKMAQALSDTMSDTEWQKSSNMVKATTKRAYGFIREAMKDTVPSIKNELDAYHDFLNNVYNPVFKKLYRGGQLVEKPIRSALKIGAEGTTKQAIKGATQMSPEINKSVSDITNYNRIMGLLKLIGLSTVGGGALHILKREK